MNAIQIPKSKEQSVNFVLVGAQKSGTTALQSYLRKHPGIYMGQRKEVHFFDGDQYFIDLPDYGLYHQNFQVASLSCTAIGDCTPSYMFWPGAIERIYRYNPQMKIIAILRDPKQRAFSHWNMQRDRGLEPFDFLDALNAEPQRCEISKPKSYKRFSYCLRGYYARQVEEIWRYFPHKQTLFLRSEELQQSPAEVLNQITDFLGVEIFKTVVHEQKHQRNYQRQMSEAETQHLAAMYAADIKRLELLLGWDCSAWL